MRRYLWFFLLFFGMALSGNTCKKATDVADTPDDECGGAVHRPQQHTVMHLDEGPFVMTTEAAAGDCTTLYWLWFRWASAERRATDGNPPTIEYLFDPS